MNNKLLMPNSSQLKFITFVNKDAALRALLFLLLLDSSYRNLPILQVYSFYNSILSNQYLFALRDKVLVAAIVWGEIGEDVKELCLQNDRSPFIGELVVSGGAIYCTAFTAKETNVLLPLWREFFKLQNKDILIKRHFKHGHKKAQQIRLIKCISPVNSSST
ncbi:hypothetical protein G6677_05860 [Polynucleobacter paneuropaeus]|nr:hypothetical protein [Polynucleobacter paneuropaeus]